MTFIGVDSAYPDGPYSDAKAAAMNVEVGPTAETSP
jgi:hypothetical protein